MNKKLNNIPSMGGTEIGEYLQHYAANVRPSECIVEVGTWFGAGTYQLCQGAIKNRKYNNIYCFDQWEARKTEIEKAKKAGIILKDKENLLPYVKNNLSEFTDTLDITFTRGKIQSIKKFDGEKIGLYVDDASKRKDNFDHIAKIFFPHLAKYATVILMDFYYYESKPNDSGLLYQRNYMLDNKQFTFIKRIPDSCCAVFRYNGV